MSTTIAYRADLPERPQRMRKLPLDKRGYPIPWFVHRDKDGVPDFRIVRRNGISYAHINKVCWLCGGKLGRFAAFVIGPMCGVNRTVSEPPSHRACAAYAVRACPFMTRPLAGRNERGLENTVPPAGVGLKRNPGVVLLWVTDIWQAINVPDGIDGARRGVLFKFGEPLEVSAWREGRRATRSEIDHSIATGIHALQEVADAEGGEAPAALARMRRNFDQLLDRQMARLAA